MSEEEKPKSKFQKISSSRNSYNSEEKPLDVKINELKEELKIYKNTLPIDKYERGLIDANVGRLREKIALLKSFKGVVGRILENKVCAECRTNPCICGHFDWVVGIGTIKAEVGEGLTNG